VIALGIKHADRVDTALRAALTEAAGRPGSRELEEFFVEDVQEPFFVKNLERVQGDERDAIIISVGYGKHSDGRMRYQWGPLLRDGGERRLNVAATRARRRLTVVSSFSSHDVDPARLTAPGARMLADYIEYARSGGMSSRTEGAACGGTYDDKRSAAGQAGLGSESEAGGLGAFEADVAARLADLGITVVPQYGVGGYRVDFAAAHPDDPSRMILAVEADGAAYRDSGSVRDRDRLRKEHLERLGWRVHRLWSTAWFTDPEAELTKLRTAFAEAVAANPPLPEPPSAPSTSAGPPAQPAQSARPSRAEDSLQPARTPGSGGTRAIPLGSGAPAAGNLPQYGESGEIATGQGTSGDREVNGYPPLLGPVDVLEVEQQRELVHDQRQPRAIGDGRDRVTPQPLVAPDRDTADPGE
jgi:very-short-patch-repair endonuclease